MAPKPPFLSPDVATAGAQCLCHLLIAFSLHSRGTALWRRPEEEKEGQAANLERAGREERQHLVSVGKRVESCYSSLETTTNIRDMWRAKSLLSFLSSGSRRSTPDFQRINVAHITEKTRVNILMHKSVNHHRLSTDNTTLIALPHWVSSEYYNLRNHLHLNNSKTKDSWSPSHEQRTQNLAGLIRRQLDELFTWRCFIQEVAPIQLPMN